MISVIVPVYKVEAYLKPCVDSILAQTYSDFELILVDDGSPDNCPQICDEYAEKDPRIRVIHQQNGGLSAARNSGLDAAVGEYITFVDSDDLVFPDFLENMIKLQNQTQADISICGIYLFHEEDGPALKKREASEKFTLYTGRRACKDVFNLNGMGVTACGKMYSSKIWTNLRFPEGIIHEDNATTPIAFYKAKFVIMTEVPLYLYRQRPQSISHRNFSMKNFDFMLAVQNCKNFFQKIDDHEIVESIDRYGKIFQASLVLQALRLKKKIDIPPEYAISKGEALGILKSLLSGDKYFYILRDLYPAKAMFALYCFKIKNQLNFLFKKVLR